MFSSGKGDPFVRTKGALLSSHPQQIKKATNGFPINAPGSKKGIGLGSMLKAAKGNKNKSNNFLADETSEGINLAFKKAPRINELLRNAL